MAKVILGLPINFIKSRLTITHLGVWRQILLLALFGIQSLVRSTMVVRIEGIHPFFMGRSFSPSGLLSECLSLFRILFVYLKEFEEIMRDFFWFNMEKVLVITWFYLNHVSFVA